MSTPNPPNPPRRAWVQIVMGLPVSLHLRGPRVDSPAAEALIAEVFAELHRVDAVFSTYRADSDVSRANRGELHHRDAHPWLAEVSYLCELARRRTGGYFDPWLPGPRGHRWWDPSGLVKGWAAARAALRLRRFAGHDVCVVAGGDIALRAEAGRAWRIGVEDPAEPVAVLDVLTVTNGAVATSGTTHRGAHIVDPRTGAPATAAHAVTVTGPSPLWADVYATAAVARGGVDWFPGDGAYQALLVRRDGGVETSPGWHRVHPHGG